MRHIRLGLPPTVIFHGKADTTVPYADVERFCMESRKLGNRCQLFGYEGATHGFFNPTREGGTWHHETLIEMDRFLTDIGYLPGPGPSNQPWGGRRNPDGSVPTVHAVVATRRRLRCVDRGVADVCGPSVRLPPDLLVAIEVDAIVESWNATEN